MENNPLQLCVLFVLLLLANAITGECSPSSQEKLNSTVPRFFTSSEKHPSGQDWFTSYTTGYKWLPLGGDNYVGLEAILDVYGFSLQPGQVSAAFIRIGDGGDGPISPSQVQVGWHVDPGFYKDSHTHFYVAWNNGGQCQGIICPGFKTTSTSGIVPGDIISPVSRFHRHKVFIKLRIFKEKNSGDWHIHYGVDGDLEPVGYFPKSLVSELVDKPVEIIFGGYVNHNKPLPSPPMGSGDIPIGGYSASFSGLKLIDEDGNDHLVDIDLQSYTDPKDCYPITKLANAQFFYGGATCVE